MWQNFIDLTLIRKRGNCFIVASCEGVICIGELIIAVEENELTHMAVSDDRGCCWNCLMFSPEALRRVFGMVKKYKRLVRNCLKTHRIYNNAVRMLQSRLA